MESTVEQNQPVNQPQSEPDVKKKKTIKNWMIVLAVIAIGIGAVVFAVVSSAKGAISAADDYIADLQAGRCSSIYEKASEEFKKSGSADAWDEACVRVSAILQGEPEQRGIDIASDSGKDQESTVSYLIDGTDGSTYGVAIGMVNRDGSWQLENFDSDELTEEDLQELELEE